MDPRLDYLHDAEVTSITFDGWPDRSICIRVCFHPDTGNATLDGKVAAARLRGVHATRYLLWPVSGTETIDRVNLTVSPEFIRSLPTPTQSAFGVSFAFHSGAVLEVICGELMLEVG